MIRLLVRMLMIEALLRRLDRRPSAVGRPLPPLSHHLGRHLVATSTPPPPIADDYFR